MIARLYKSREQSLHLVRTPRLPAPQIFASTLNIAVVFIDNCNFLNSVWCEVKIMVGDKYLSCTEYYDYDNNVVLKTFDDHSGRQTWIIERAVSGDFFIRASVRRHNGSVYLGAPNESNVVHLYTTKNEYTKWQIRKIPDKANMYQLLFIGMKFDPSCVELVVARYEENIDWVKAYSNIVTVYNKGSNLDYPGINIITLPNVGREGHTYLTHMMNKLESVNVTEDKKRYIYCQGNPFDHNETFLYGVDNFDRLAEVQPLGLVYLRSDSPSNISIPPPSVEREITHYTDFGLKYGVMVVDGNLRTHLFQDDGIENINVTFRRSHKYKGSLMEYFMMELGCPKKIDKVLFTYSALFSITHETLRRFSLSYKIPIIINTLLKMDNQGSEHGYILERLWLFMFGYETPEFKEDK